MFNRVCREQQVCLDLQEKKANQVCQDLLVHPDPKDHEEKEDLLAKEV